jgi:hypothetical protein
MRHVLPAILALAAAACEQSGATVPSTTYIGIDGHSVFFQLAGTSHDPSATGSPVQCASCHTADTFTKFTCTTCHNNSNPGGTDVLAQTDALHSGIPPQNGVSYAFDSATCLLCHPKGAITHTFFPIGAGSFHNLTCIQCHTDLTAKTDTTKLACISCHCAAAGSCQPPAGLLALNVAHAALKTPDFPVTVANLDCIRCHSDGQVDRIADHGLQRPPPGLTGPGPAGPYASQADQHAGHCFTCHASVPPMFQNPPVNTGTRPWAQDWGPVGMTCQPCHP